MSSIFNWQSGQPFAIVSGRGTLNRNGRSGNNRARLHAERLEIRSLLLGMTESGGDLFFINPSNVTGATEERWLRTERRPSPVKSFSTRRPGIWAACRGMPSMVPVTSTGTSWWPRSSMSLKVSIWGSWGVFQLINNVNFNPPSTWNVNSTSFGQITSATGAPRIVQFALKILW